jgi:D-beta-D-heptose 7-phosphate kinase/D-beta-D-heptose 1-phosphate adenosyltransferase
MCFNVANNLAALGCHVDTLRNIEMIYKERFVDVKTKQHLLRSDFGENNNIEPLSVMGIEFESYDAVVISDYNKGFVTSENALLISKHCMQSHIPLFVDSKKRDLSCFDGATIKINEKEWDRVTRYPHNYELVVTMGAKGASWNNNTYKTKECEVFDVSGAGDTFLASLVSEYLHTNSFEKAIAFANSCSRIVVQKFGTYCLKKKDLEQI